MWLSEKEIEKCLCEPDLDYKLFVQKEKSDYERIQQRKLKSDTKANQRPMLKRKQFKKNNFKIDAGEQSV